MEWGEEETSNPAPGPGLCRGQRRPPGFLYLLMARTCAELGALIQGLFLPPNGSVGFTSVPARLNHLWPEIMLMYPWRMGCGLHTRDAQLTLRVPVAFFSGGEGPAKLAQASLWIPGTSAQSPGSWPNLGWVLEGCQDLEVRPQFPVQRPGKSVGPWVPAKISGSKTSTDENSPSCPMVPFWQSKRLPREAVSGFNSLLSWGCVMLGMRGTAQLMSSCCESESLLGQETQKGPINSRCPDSLFKMDEEIFSPSFSVLQMWMPAFGGGIKWGSAPLRDVPGCPPWGGIMLWFHAHR